MSVQRRGRLRAVLPAVSAASRGLHGGIRTAEAPAGDRRQLDERGVWQRRQSRRLRPDNPETGSRRHRKTAVRLGFDSRTSTFGIRC